MPYDISREKRDWYREISVRSRERKKAAIHQTLRDITLANETLQWTR